MPSVLCLAAAPWAALSPGAGGSPLLAAPRQQGTAGATALDLPPVVYGETAGRGRNVLVVNNPANDRLRVRGAIQLNRVTAPGADPVNRAEAWNVGTCGGCQTSAVSVQIILVARAVGVAVAPQNRALAAGSECSACDADAWALQYRLVVDDPAVVPPAVTQLIRALDRELRALATEPDVTLPRAKDRVEASLAQNALPGAVLDDARDTYSRPAVAPAKNLAMVINNVDGSARMRGACS